MSPSSSFSVNSPISSSVNLLGTSAIHASVIKILEQALAGVDISTAEAVVLLQQDQPEAIEAIRATADRLRQVQVGDRVTYVINRNINFTNICEQHCSFCAFRRDAEQPGAFWLDFTDVLAKTTEAVARGATEICMQGGLNLQAKINGSSLAYYQKVVETIKGNFPHLHLHAFSPQEIQFIAREDGLSYAQVIQALQEAGVGSMPGTAAEILDDRLRQILCPEKLNTATWLEIISTAHSLGMFTTSTMLSGHLETPTHQAAHLHHLRCLQQKAIEQNYPARITEFIILPFVGESAPKPLRSRVGRDQPILADNLLLTAVARIFLGKWIPHQQPSWVKLGLSGATTALRWGCNDLGGTLMEEHITTMAGAKGGTSLEPWQLREAINSLDRPCQQRDTLYNLI